MRTGIYQKGLELGDSKVPFIQHQSEYELIEEIVELSSEGIGTSDLSDQLANTWA